MRRHLPIVCAAGLDPVRFRSLAAWLTRDVAEGRFRPGFWGFHQTRARSAVELIRMGTLDAELAALVWLLVEARLPLIVAARAPRVGKSTTLNALLDFLPPSVSRVELAGAAEDFQWLPEAASLGWRSERAVVSRVPPRPDSTYLIAAELSNHLPVYTWGDQARIAIRALSLGYGMGATIHAGSLEEVFGVLGAPPLRLSADELSWLGVVLILGLSPTGERRMTAAHYVRPVARDVHGHLQRLGPAVLATWDPARDAFEHFGWGVITELAERVERKAGDFELEQRRRAEYLGGLADGGVTGVAEVQAALRGYSLEGAVQPGN